MMLGKTRGTNLIVRIGTGKANLRGVSARLAESEKPSLLSANEVPSIVPWIHMSGYLPEYKKCGLTPDVNIAFRVQSMERHTPSYEADDAYSGYMESYRERCILVSKRTLRYLFQT